ncbi:MAG: leucine-rich repeat domain-containing protein, partial [Candidatus Hodarchaeota archaeon]
MDIFKINDIISLKLENGITNIYIKDVLFRQCKYIILDKIPLNKVEKFIKNFKSVDEKIENLNHSLGHIEHIEKIPPETEFWAHCSNIQVWVENRYNSKLLHSNLAFPLLKKLSELGDTYAKIRLKEEIIERFHNSPKNTQEFLAEEGYIDLINNEEKYNLLKYEKEEQAIRSLEQTISESLKIDTRYIHFNKSIIIENGIIKGLVLCGCDFTKVPKIIKNLKNLEILFIGGAPIKKLPSWIGMLNSLEDITIRGTMINTLPPSFGLLKKLKTLDLTSNEIETLPIMFGNLINLKELDLRMNKLNHLPESFGNLMNLKILKMYDNNLKKLPNSIGNLLKIKSISLRNNELTEIPNSICKLKELEFLDLCNNRIEKLPD